MSFGTRRAARNKLSNRLARVYGGLFAAILLLLTVTVFALAYRFLTSRQAETLRATLELTGDHIVEELAEGESITDPAVLQEQNTSGNLSFFIRDGRNHTVNRVLNFPMNEADAENAGSEPRLVLDADGRMLLCCAQNIQEDDVFYGRLYMVQNLETEQAFLKMLALLLLGANLSGCCAALLIGKATSRRMLSPIEQMIGKAARIDEKNLTERLETPERDDELRSLALTVNNMLDRVSSAYDQQGRFVADVSHELRTPLAVMQGNVDLLSRWGSDDPAVLRESIEALQKQTDYMGKLVENLLFLARCDHERRELSKTTFPVSELFSELLEEQSLIDTEHDYCLDLPAAGLQLTADRAMIKQALRALLDNSVKYTPAGGQITLHADRGGGVRLSVSDTGAGMDEPSLAHIFERFYRVDKARARATGGMGLGLSIVQAIAEAHGGSAGVVSKIGKGTAVTIALPE